MIYTITSKQAAMIKAIERNPGINTHQLAQTVGRSYAHGSVQFTYETIGRLLRHNGATGGRRRPAILVTGPSANGRGAGLYSCRQIADTIEAFARAC